MEFRQPPTTTPTTFSVGTALTVGTTIHSTGVIDTDSNLKILGTGSTDGIFTCANTSTDKTYTFPNLTGTVKLLQAESFFWTCTSAGGGVSSDTCPSCPVYPETYIYIPVSLPFASPPYVPLTYTIIANFNVDGASSYQIDFYTTYGSSTEAPNTHTGSITGQNYVVTPGQRRTINVASAFSSFAGGDLGGIKILNNNVGASDIIYVYGIEITATPPY